jgi:energy-coupling factor transporter transmembrane protein EcfT
MGFYTLFILICGLVYGAYISIKNEKTLLAIISTSVLLIIIGYSTYFTIFIRSGQNPVIDENNPETIEEAISYLNRDQYGNISFFPRKFDNLPSKIAIVGKPEYKDLEFSNKQNYDYATYKLSEQMTFLWSYQINKMYLRYFLWQFAGKGSTDDSFVSPLGASKKQDGVDWSQFGLPLALMIGLYGLYFHFRKNQYDAFSLLVLFIMTGIAIVFYLNQDNPQPRERDYSYVGSFMTFSIWIAIGIFGFIRKINHTFLERSFKLPASYFMITMFLAFIPIRMLLANYHEHDRTGNYIAWDMAYNMLQTCKPNAILFTNGDNDTFPLWYLQEVEGIRKDISVTNLSLLNTPWYVKQLQDQNQKNSFINMSENEINNLDFKAWSPTIISIPAPKDSLNNSGKIEWKLNPTYFDVALRIQDLMVLRIIKDNNWNRPVYFAVTVSPTSMLNLEEYLTMEGLAYRLSNNTSQIIDVDAMTNNLLSIIGDESWFIDYNKNYNNNTNLSISKTYQPGYIYRNLANDNIYVDPQLGRLIQNYRTGFTRLAISHYLNKNFGKAEKVLLDMEKKMPTDIIELPSKELQYQIGQLYGGLGNKVKLRYHLNQLIERNDLAINDYLLYGKTFIQTLEDYNEAKTIFKTIYDNFTIIEKALEVQGFKSTKITSLEWKEWQESLPELVFLLYLCYKELEEYDNAILLMEDWLVRSPTDLEATKLLDEIKELQNL